MNIKKNNIGKDPNIFGKDYNGTFNYSRNTIDINSGIEPAAFNEGLLTFFEGGMNDLSGHIGVGLYEVNSVVFPQINSAEFIQAQNATYLEETCINEDVLYGLPSHHVEDVESLPIEIVNEDRLPTLAGIKNSSAIYSESEFCGCNSVTSPYSGIKGLQVQDTNYLEGVVASREVLEESANWYTDARSITSVDNMASFGFFTKAELNKFGSTGVSSEVSGTETNQFQDIDYMIGATTSKGILDGSTSWYRDARIGADFNEEWAFALPINSLESEIYSSNSAVSLNVAGTEGVQVQDTNYLEVTSINRGILGGSPSSLAGTIFGTLDRDISATLVGDVNNSLHYLEMESHAFGPTVLPYTTDPDSVLLQNISTGNLDGPKVYNQIWELAPGHAEEMIEGSVHISNETEFHSANIGSLRHFNDFNPQNIYSANLDSLVKNDSVRGFNSLNKTSKEKIEGIVGNILPEQVGEIEYGVNYSAEGNNYTLNIFVFINGDISGNAPHLGHKFYFNQS